MATGFIDIEAFRDDNANYVIKELCIMDVCSMFEPLVYVFRPNMLWRNLTDKAKTVNGFLIRHRHGLQWHEGNSYFCTQCIGKDICDRFDIRNTMFYVKDQIDGQKFTTLHLLFPELNMTTYSISTDSVVPDNIICPYREHGPYCAYRKCLKLCVDFVSCK